MTCSYLWLLEERAVSLEKKRRGPIEDLFRRYNRQDLVSNGIKGLGVEVSKREREKNQDGARISGLE